MSAISTVLQIIGGFTLGWLTVRGIQLVLVLRALSADKLRAKRRGR